MGKHLKIIIDYDGTLTAEETQVAALAEKSLETLAKEIVGAPRERLAADYQAMRTRLLRAPTTTGGAGNLCWLRLRGIEFFKNLATNVTKL